VNDLRAAILRGARRTRAGGAAVRGARPGDGFAFDRLREYAAGDDPRRIDWSATARIGALQTRVYVEETVLVLAALVDESPSMNVGRRRSLRSAADEAVRTWFAAAEGADRAQRVVDDRIVGDRRAAVEVRAAGPFDLVRQLELAVRALPLGSSLLVVTDALDLGAEVAVDELLAQAAQRFDATVMVASDPWIGGLPLRGLVRVRDVETGRSRRLWIGGAARRRYGAASTARDAAIRTRFERARWRIGTLDEADGAASLARTFGLR
jgi:uncharacterized protein (DUF58 family)